MDLDSRLATQLRSLNVEKAVLGSAENQYQYGWPADSLDIVSSSMDNRPEQQRVSNLPMKPLHFIHGQPFNLGPNYTQ